MVKSTNSLKQTIKYCIMAAVAVLLALWLVALLNSQNFAHAEAICLDGSKPGDGGAGIIGGQAVVLCKDGKNPVESSSIAGVTDPNTALCPDGKPPTKKVGVLYYCETNGAVTTPTTKIPDSCSKLISTPWQPIFCIGGSGGSVNTNAAGIVNVITDTLTGLLGIVLVITILVSAIQIISAGTSPEALSSARKRLGTAALSLGLLIGLRAILALIGI